MPEIQLARSPHLRPLPSKDVRNQMDLKNPLKKTLYEETDSENPMESRKNDFTNIRLFGKDLEKPIQHVLNARDLDDREEKEEKEVGRKEDIEEREEIEPPVKEEDVVTQLMAKEEIGEEEEEEEDDDEQFANVDEIDGPVSPSSSSGSLKDYFQSLEISFSHNSPKHLKKKSIEIKEADENQERGEDKINSEDENLPIDDALKELLDEKASQIESGELLPSISKPKLNYSYQDFYSLFAEVDEWFVRKDYVLLKESKLCFEKTYDSKKFNEDHKYAQSVIEELGRRIQVNSMNSDALLSIAYICFGSFGNTSNFFSHLEMTRRNNILLLSISKIIISCMKRHAECCRDRTSNLNQFTTFFFYSSTILFFIVCVSIEQREKRKYRIEKLISEICEEEVLLFITQYIDHWRWNSRLSMRIRNIILLFQKIVLLEFGTDEHFLKVQSYVRKKHDIPDENNDPTILKITPLEFLAFKEDITSRYPSCEVPDSPQTEELDNPNSLSQFLEIIRPKSRSTSNEGLPEPQIHLATPAPSPPSSPAPMGGTKIRKSFQTNLSYPSFFPLSVKSEEGILTELDTMNSSHPGNAEVPCNIQETIDIITRSIEVDLSTKQLWYERKLFMKEERGWVDVLSTDEYPFSYSNDDTDEARTMTRVEKYYHQSLPYMSSLVYVLLESIETNISNKVYLKDNNLEINSPKIRAQLEITRSKEIAMRSSSSILKVLLKWFSLNHILKFEYLSSLIYDSKFIGTSLEILDGFTANYKERIFGKIVDVEYSFWKECANYNQSYRCIPEDLSLLTSTTEFNMRMFSSEVSLLSILADIIGKKTQRLKDLPLSVGNVFKNLYQIHNLDIYHPILKIIYQLTPFKNKKWRSEHMELISGVFLHEKLSLSDNWITGKDVPGELSDAYGQEVALRAMLQFYNFHHYKDSMEKCGYDSKSSNSFFSREAELLSIQY